MGGERPVNRFGEQIGAYGIIREIGHGGMGTVYLAERTEGGFHQQVAVKLIKHGMDSNEILTRFRSERQILARLQHPNIARLFDGGMTDEGVPYFAMEYIEGECIDVHCRQNRLSIRARLELFQQVCSAVQYAHQNLIVHRDLKPGNILVSGDGTVKLLDFGIAKVLAADGESPLTTLTRTGFRAVTPEYAAPEQFRGGAVTTATDVYSLGVILFELLTGNIPYRLTNRTPFEIEQAVCDSQPKRPSTATATRAFEPESGSHHADAGHTQRAATKRLKRELCGDLDNICLKALRKEPERRYRSAVELAEDIERYLAGRPVTARADTLGYRARKFVQRNRTAVVAAISMLLMLASLVTFYTIRLAAERDQARVEAQKAEQISDFLSGLFEVSDPSHAKGETVTAKELLNRGAGRIENELQNQPQVQATMMNVMGNVYRNLGFYGEASALFLRASDIQHSAGVSNALELAETMDNLAVLQRLTGEYKSSENYARQALALRRKQLGDNHLDVATTLNSLAEVLRVQGEYQTAEKLYHETLSIRRSLLGNTHRDVADTMNNLALLLYRIGKYQDAERLHREALSVRYRLLGEHDPDVSNSMNNLAVLLKAQGQYQEAETLYRQALKLRRKVLGEDEPRTINTLSNLGRLLHAKGDFTAADSLLRQALALFKKRLGDSHPYVAKSSFYLGCLMHDQGGLSEAESLFRRSLELYERLLPEGHLNIARTQIGLGRVLISRGEPTTGLRFLQQGLEARRTKLPEDHWEIAEAEVAMGGCLVELTEYQQAEPLLLHGYNVLKKSLGKNNQLTRRTAQQLVNLYEKWGSPSDAEKYRRLL